MSSLTTCLENPGKKQPRFPGFEHIGIRTWLYTPENAHAGELIIICSWLGAMPRYIAKYISMHQRIAPRARILLIESNIRILASPYIYQRAAIQPAVGVVRDSMLLAATAFENPVPPKILLHTFSNGGANSATQLLLALRKQVREPLPLIGVILDSSPARVRYWRAHQAMVFSLSPVSRIPGTFAVHGMLVALYAWMAMGNEDPAQLMRRTLLDDSALQPDKKDGAAQVCYLYSETDKMVHWQDVWDHAGNARLKGWDVEEVMFEGTDHCAHLRKDELLYTQAVERMWNRNGGTGKTESKL